MPQNTVWLHQYEKEILKHIPMPKNFIPEWLMDDAGMPMMLLTLVLHNANTPELAKTSLNLT